MNDGIDWHPQLFRRVQGGHGGTEEGEEDLDWIINAKVDGKTPDEQIKQILQIAAILPGQTPHRQFNIPRHNSLERLPTRSSVQADAEKPKVEEPQQQAFGDLIDLSDPVVPQSNAQSQPQPQLPKPSKVAPKAESQDSKDDDLMKGIPPSKLLHSTPGEPSHGKTLRRKDSDTQEDDEFHDANS